MYYFRYFFLFILPVVVGGFQLQAQEPVKDKTGTSSVIISKDTLKPSGNVRCYNIPKLTQDQEIKIDRSRIALQKERNQLLIRIDEKEAYLRRMNSEEEAEAAITDKVLDEIAVLKTLITKAEDKHIQEIRAVLTDEQKAFFDSRPRPDFGKGQMIPSQPKKQKRVPSKGPACR